MLVCHRLMIPHRLFLYIGILWTVTGAIAVRANPFAFFNYPYFSDLQEGAYPI